MLELRPGQRIEELLIERRLGAGGMGSVYLANDTLLGHRVALKIAFSGGVSDEGVRARFAREAELLARLPPSPGVVGIHRVGKAPDGSSLIVMELVEGTSLAALVREKGPLPPDEAARLGELMARAVAHLHANGILHRDLKPENVIVSPDRGPVIVDFGLGRAADAKERLTRTGDVLGTPSYMPPEAVDSARGFDERSDVYGVGATLFYALTGRAPFEALSMIQLLATIVKQGPPLLSAVSPDTPRELATIVERAMSSGKDARHPTALALAEDLARNAAGRPRVAGPRRRRHALVAAAATVAALAGAGVALRARGAASGDAQPSSPAEGASGKAVSNSETPQRNGGGPAALPDADGLALAERALVAGNLSLAVAAIETARRAGATREPSDGLRRLLWEEGVKAGARDPGAESAFDVLGPEFFPAKTRRTIELIRRARWRPESGDNAVAELLELLEKNAKVAKDAFEAGRVVAGRLERIACDLAKNAAGLVIDEKHALRDEVVRRKLREARRIMLAARDADPRGHVPVGYTAPVSRLTNAADVTMSGLEAAVDAGAADLEQLVPADLKAKETRLAAWQLHGAFPTNYIDSAKELEQDPHTATLGHWARAHGELLFADAGERTAAGRIKDAGAGERTAAGHIKDAGAAARAFLALRPDLGDFPLIRLPLARVLASEGLRDDSIEAIERALACFPTWRVLVSASSIHLERGEAAPALEDADTAVQALESLEPVKLQPNHGRMLSRAYTARARAHRALGHTAQADDDEESARLEGKRWRPKKPRQP